MDLKTRPMAYIHEPAPAEHGGGAATAPCAGRAPLRPAAFLDKDGTLIQAPAHGADPTRPRLAPGVVEGLRVLQDHGFVLIVVSNQPELAHRQFDRMALNRLHERLSEVLQQMGVHIDDYYVCPHAPPLHWRQPGCLCRKPAPGLLRQAALAHRINLAHSWMIGDLLDDVEAGHRAGCSSVLLDVGNESEWRVSPLRMPDVRANTLFEAAAAIVHDMTTHASRRRTAPSPPDRAARALAAARR